MLSNSSAIADPSVEAALCALEAGLVQVSKVRTDALSSRDRLTALTRLEAVARTLPGLGLGLVAQLREQWSVEDFGRAGVSDVLADTLRISPAEARARYRAADDLAPRTSTSGTAIEPVMAATAAAQRDGAIGPAHVQILREFFHHIPACVDFATRTRAEVELAQHARMMRPDKLRQVADRVDAILNPDGNFTDADRQRRRGFTMGRQGPDLMSKCTVIADPELRAYLEAICAKYAKPGACNPEDANPQVDDEPDPDAVRRDSRSAGQRQHDAVKAVLRATLASGDLGQHRGLPVTVVVSMGLAELEAAAAQATRAADPYGERVTFGRPVVTGGGSLLPIRDALRMAAHAHHYLALFDNADGRPIYLGRAKRIATADQRIILHAKDIGCTYPGCAKPGYLCQTHHRNEWADGGTTDADQLTFVCEPHHRMAGTRGSDWTTAAAPPGHPKAGRTQWIPPAHVDPHRTRRMNSFHHPGEYLTPDSEFGGGLQEFVQYRCSTTAFDGKPATG
ncbi:HNH endonuclease signature motif containing protein [Nocardia sp. KC 131]|uniref:HNH endonuclease signature motif containing protein n=1 Tax=Nocardia arseniciresistens TaxID=3392119 RepID=UPI00398E7426